MRHAQLAMQPVARQIAAPVLVLAAIASSVCSHVQARSTAEYFGWCLSFARDRRAGGDEPQLGVAVDDLDDLDDDPGLAAAVAAAGAELDGGPHFEPPRPGDP